MTQLTLFSGKQLRDAAIQRTIAHANAVHSDWTLQAYQFLIRYLMFKPAGFTFMCEDVVIASADFVPEPPNKKAWGDTMLKGRRAGLMKFHNYGQSNVPTHNAGTKTIWLKI